MPTGPTARWADGRWPEYGCWGDNARGQLGDGTSTSSPTPVVDRLDEDVVMITAGRDHTCAVDVLEQGWCWGANTLGQLGIGTTMSTAVGEPQRVLIDGAIRIDAGDEHTCAINGLGRVECFGSNAFGPVLPFAGIGALVSTPTVADEGPVTALDVSAGGRHSCAVLETGDILCWGDNTAGQLGSDARTPGPSHVPLGDAVDVSCGRDHTCAVRGSGEVVCWGDNSTGQLGSADAGGTRPTPVPLP